MSALLGEGFKAAREKLGLTQSQLADLLETDSRSIRAIESRVGTSRHRDPAPRMLRLLSAYIAGYRPEDWPTTFRGNS
jgi:DNA-binding transcriptional regulator YiaG